MAVITVQELKRFDRLSYWFIAHGVVDLLIAIPLMVAPEAALEALGWHSVDLFSSRIVAAALIGIGLESLLTIRAELYSVKRMLELKIFWGGAAIIGMIVSAVAEPSIPWGLWPIVATFAVFVTVWVIWRIRISGFAGK